jgi:TRAP-type C4-dicarboxylate transport system substrate-binding protein
MEPIFDKILQEKFNAKGLGTTNTGGLGMWSQRPIKTLEDMKGMLTASVSPVTSICKNFTAMFSIPTPAGWSINLDVWKKMSPNIQKILLEEVAKSAQWMNNVVVNDIPDKDIKVFKEKGVSVYILPKAERDRWAKQLEATTNAELAKFGELGKQMKKIADEANKKYPYKADKAAI